MIKLYVIDTCSLISFFYEVFGQAPKISLRSRKIISEALHTNYSEIRISIPSVVFVEIFEKWFNDEEFSRKFYYEVLTPVIQSPNVEIKSLDREVLENLFLIGGDLFDHDLNDKIVLASAMMLGCPLITLDGKLIEYINGTGVLPAVIQ